MRYRGWHIKHLIVHLPGTVHKFLTTFNCYLRDHCLKLCLIFGKLEGITQSPFFLKLPNNHMSSDDFRGNRR